MELYYTVHPNWRWILKVSLQWLPTDFVGKSYPVETPRELPSQLQKITVGKEGNELRVLVGEKTKVPRVKYAYALFRLELTLPAAVPRSIACCEVWATSLAFASLDAKDELYRVLLTGDRGFHSTFTSFTLTLSTAYEPLHLATARAENLMPETILIAYDVISAGCYN